MRSRLDEIRAYLPAGAAPVFGDGSSMPMRELSNDNYDRRWIAQGDDVEAMGVGDTPQEAAIEYARAVADLLRPMRNPDALDGKGLMRAKAAIARGEVVDKSMLRRWAIQDGKEPDAYLCLLRGDCGDGPPCYEEWSR